MARFLIYSHLNAARQVMFLVVEKCKTTVEVGGSANTCKFMFSVYF